MKSAKGRGPRLSKAESRELTRTRLIAAATQVITERGFQASSIEAITHAAGYTRGAFYSNFTSREDLLLEVWSAQLAKSLTDSAARRHDTVVDVHRAIDEAGASAAYQPFFLIQMELWQHAVRHPEFRPKLVAEYRRRHDSMRREAEDLAAANGFSLPVSGDVLATVLHSYLLGWQLLYEVDGPGGDYDTYFTGLHTLFDAFSVLGHQRDSGSSVEKPPASAAKR